jgi:hypothetical protein
MDILAGRPLLLYYWNECAYAWLNPAPLFIKKRENKSIDEKNIFIIKDDGGDPRKNLRS